MTIVARAPSPILAPFVSWLGYYETLFPAVREVLMPRGAMALVVNLAGDDTHWYDGDGFATPHTAPRAVVVGACAGRIGVDLADLGAVVGVLFRPGGAYPFFREPVSVIDQPIVELESVWGGHSGLLRERLLAAPTPDATLATFEDILVERLVHP